MDINLRKKFLLTAVTAALEAGKRIMQIYNSGNFEVQLKSDNSPLTLADKKAHDAIVQILSPLEIPILSEEGELKDFEERKDWEYCWIIDPLDGTKEFIKRNNEFTVNIALIQNQEPLLGIIYVPVSRNLYIGDINLGAFRLDEFTQEAGSFDELLKKAKVLPSTINNRKFTVVGSRSHMNSNTQTFIDAVQPEKAELNFISKGSSLKLCMIAEGKADIYPRFGPTMEWDTAAGHAIVKAAGYQVVSTENNTPLLYNKKQLTNPWFIAASNGEKLY